MELLQRTASLPGGSERWNFRYARPHFLGAAGSAAPSMHCHTAWGQWVVEHLQRTASLPGGIERWNFRFALPHFLPSWGQWAVQFLQTTATPPGGGRQWNSCNARAHQLGGQGVLPRRRSLPTEWNSCNTLPHRLGAVGSGTPAIQCPTAWGQRAVQLLQCTASLHGGSGRCSYCNALPHCLGQWTVQLLQCTATPPRGSGQWNSCNTLPHCLGALGIGLPAMHCLTAWEQWAVQPCCGVVWCGVVWCGVVWCGVVWCGVVWCGVVWRGVVWCGVVWCGVVWCGVVCRRRCYQMAKGGDVYPRAKVNGLGRVCAARALCVSVLVHSRTSALSHLADTALPTLARSHTGSHWSSALCVPRCTISAFCVVPHCLVLCTTPHYVCPAALLLWAEGSGQCNALPRRLGVVGSGNPASHCRIAWGQWGVVLLPYTASVPWGSGPDISCHKLSHCLGAVGSATPSMHCAHAWGVGSGSPAIHCLPRGSGQRASCYTLPHCLGAVGSGPPAIHCPNAWGQWAVQLLLCLAPIPGGSGQWISCNTLPHCLGAVGSGSPAMWCGVVWCAGVAVSEKKNSKCPIRPTSPKALH